jgi:hypothetical protein
VILAGYSFDHARDVLAPLHRSMLTYDIDARFFIDLPRVERGSPVDRHVARNLAGFFVDNWPFGRPRPRL